MSSCIEKRFLEGSRTSKSVRVSCYYSLIRFEMMVMVMLALLVQIAICNCELEAVDRNQSNTSLCKQSSLYYGTGRVRLFWG